MLLKTFILANKRRSAISSPETSVSSFALTFTSTVQTVSIPSGVTRIKAYMWGGAGGGGVYTTGNNNRSGAGGYTFVELSVTPGDQVSVYVARGGGPGVAATRGGYGGWPDGGYGTRGDTAGGGGGGSTRLYLNNTLIGVAGGGGGISGYQPTGGTYAGAGGGTSGQDSAGALGNNITYGGTQTSGGYDSNDPADTAKKGGSFQGGQGGDATISANTTDDGGGGGGGYFGGGGGGGDAHHGGGGSGYVNTSAVVSGYTSRSSAGKVVETSATNPYYVAPYARGVSARPSGTGVSGNNGYVHIVFFGS